MSKHPNNTPEQKEKWASQKRRYAHRHLANVGPNLGFIPQGQIGLFSAPPKPRGAFGRTKEERTQRIARRLAAGRGR